MFQCEYWNAQLVFASHQYDKMYDILYVVQSFMCSLLGTVI